MNCWKRILLVFVIGVIIMDNDGCGKMLSYEELAEQKLEERYDMPFEVVDVLGGNIGDEYYTVTAYQADDPKTLFRATVSNDGLAETDNYVCKLVCQRISERIARNLDELNGIYYIHTAFLVDPPGLTDVEMTAEEYLEQYPGDTYHIYLNYCPDRMDPAALYESLGKIFQGLGNVRGRIYLYIVDERTLGQIQGYLEEHDKMYDDYQHMVEPYEAGIIPFEDGKIQLTGAEIRNMVGN